MTEPEAKLIYEEFCKTHGINPVLIATRQHEGCWWFIEKEEPKPYGEYWGVVVRHDQRAFRFLGALGKVFRNGQSTLGLPTSNELFLAAAGWARYQTFDNGIAIWDGGKFIREGGGEGNIAHMIQESLIPLPRQMCIVAFFDLRGFTTWSGKTSEDVQKAIRAFEEAVRIGFPTDGQHWLRLFIKGTGDGVMIVSQADWYQDDEKNTRRTEVKPGHGKDFFQACKKTLLLGRDKLKEFPLPIGCAIGIGELDRVFLFGRLDYIGPAANDVAKLQQHARNEICLTDEFHKVLQRDGENPPELSVMGWRLPCA